MRRLAFLLAILVMPAAAWPQSAPRAEILVLGTFHMANPGHDINNMHVDDVLAPKRQAEIAELIAVLERFRPTKIAIEAEVGSKRAPQQYADYRAGTYTLSRNEIDQIGYRLAKELGHAAIYPVDVDGDFPWMRVTNYAKANGRTAAFDSVGAGWAAMTKEQDAFLGAHTVLETLRFMNADARVRRDVALYFALARFGEPWEYAGPDLLASWYQRNIRIYHNITALIDSPNERILVLYGAGHLGWLREDAAKDTTVRLRTLEELAASR